MIENIIEREEGFRPNPYLCSEGYVTIGYGTKIHKLQGMKPEDFSLRVTKESGFALLQDELIRVISGIGASRVSAYYTHLSEERKTIIISMAYQMGLVGILNFHKMWRAISLGNFDLASEEMLDSMWAKQTSGRAKRHAQVMKSGSLATYKD